MDAGCNSGHAVKFVIFVAHFIPPFDPQDRLRLMREPQREPQNQLDQFPDAKRGEEHQHARKAV
jgi:hypothetical protein